MIDLAGNNEPKVCCRNYVAMVDYINHYGDSADIARLFSGILGPNLSRSPFYCLDGEPLSYHYLTNTLNWLPNSLNLIIFSNLGQLP
ncbi:hypothetical protein [Arsukibacterium sp.]|uniref:hypothetical protein n=1 Tax=Arsukibacterium sp. TaxID=1977258 RepID=UPI002FDAC042